MAKRLAHEADLHDRDFYSWALRQAELVRAWRLGELDLENIAEELESLGKEQAHKLESAFRVLLVHLLEWRHQPQRRSRSWRGTIVRERNNVERVLEDNPGLKPRRNRLFATAYRGTRKEAAAETGLRIATFPEAPPFTLDQATDEDFWPEPDARS
ncbi:MAG TPA: DUF29 domain-containing protein [Geminicoccaceae bacterium]|nr:DUF29 domain-containing protein [Geminicoccaceae bacterium]